MPTGNAFGLKPAQRKSFKHQYSTLIVTPIVALHSARSSSVSSSVVLQVGALADALVPSAEGRGLTAADGLKPIKEADSRQKANSYMWITRGGVTPAHSLYSVAFKAKRQEMHGFM